MECPICFEVIINTCMGTCNHEYCNRCLTKWLFSGGTNCPLCKKYIYNIRFDNNSIYQFDVFNGYLEYIKKIKKTIIIDFNDNDILPPGITVSKNADFGIPFLLKNLFTNLIII